MSHTLSGFTIKSCLEFQPYALSKGLILATVHTVHILNLFDELSE